MKIHYDDEATKNQILVDEVRLAAFLLEQGMSKRRLNVLTIRFQYMSMVHPEPQHVFGECFSSTLIHVYTHNRADFVTLSEDRLNLTLLHELRHTMQPDRVGYMDVPYSDRPTEIDARAFSERYKLHRFLSYTPKYPPAPKPVIAVSLFLSLYLLMRVVHRF